MLHKRRQAFNTIAQYGKRCMINNPCQFTNQTYIGDKCIIDHNIDRLISQGKKVIRYPLNGTWIDIGTPQEYERAKDLYKHL